MTSGERRALLFLLLVALLGAAVRGCRRSPDPPAAADIAALDAQINSVAARRASGRKRPASGERRAKDSAPEPSLPRARLDLDAATEAELTALPYIGPALARRIVEDRIRHGAFGCMDNLDSVPGIGPATLRRIDSLITFRGTGPRATRCR